MQNMISLILELNLLRTLQGFVRFLKESGISQIAFEIYFNDHGLQAPREEIAEKFTPTTKFLGTAKAYFVCHIGPNFQISLIYAFIGCL